MKDVEEKGCQDGSLWDAVLEVLHPASLAVSGKGEAAIANHLHDHEDPACIRE